MFEIDIPEPQTAEGIIFRQNHIGASDAPIIMNVSPWRTYEQLLQEKAGIIPPQPENSNMRRGKTLEAQALRLFEMEKNLWMAPQGIRHPKLEFMTASLDGLCMDGRYAVEIKCPGKRDHATAYTGKVPDKYYPQLQHQLEVSGLDKMYYYSYLPSGNANIPPETITLEVYRDQAYIDKLLQEINKFWGLLKDIRKVA